jgi:hypothetical protein
MAANMSFPSVKHEIIPATLIKFISFSIIIILFNPTNAKHNQCKTNPTNIQPNTNSAMLSDNSSLNVVF